MTRSWGQFYFEDHVKMVSHSNKKVKIVHERTSIDRWHKRLGHLTNKIVHFLIKIFSLLVTKISNVLSLCSSCSINKAHRQPFRVSSFQSHAPLDIIYTDVWGPAHIIGIDDLQYYLILVDHYTKYM